MAFVMPFPFLREALNHSTSAGTGETKSLGAFSRLMIQSFPKERKRNVWKSNCLWKSDVHTLCKPAVFPDSSTYFMGFHRFAC